MSFNSLNFLWFFLVVYTAYRALGKSRRAQNVLLLVASYFFYGAWDYRFLALILLSTAIDYVVGASIARTEDQAVRKRWLLLSIFSNLGILGFFKYFNFFAESLSSLLSLSSDSLTLSIVLPVGISFYTFQSLSYTIDIYRGEMEPCKSFPDFALYVAFFPQLVAGPIERAKRLIRQVENPRSISSHDVELGLYLLYLGYYATIGSILRPFRFAIAIGLAPAFERTYKKVGEKLGVPRPVSIFLVTMVANAMELTVKQKTRRFHQTCHFFAFGDIT